MHSSIFQISTQPIGKENYIDENTFIDGDFSFYDYCANMSDEQHKEEISDLVEYKLPKGMFELTSEDTILYKGGVEQWKKEFVANIHEKAETLTVENMLEWRPLYNLEQAIENPLDTNYRFYLDGDGNQSFTEASFAFMEFVCGLEPDTTLHVGGVVDYHF
jgi:hypothetical protein